MTSSDFFLNIQICPFFLDLTKRLFFDHSCGALPYCLNREPREFKFVKMNTDGGHWLGQKRLKKPGQSGKGGHLGCSDGYNYNLYRPLSPIHINTEGREQMHAVLEKCANTLRFMSYENFMIWMSVFFSVRNLMSMGIV